MRRAYIMIELKNGTKIKYVRDTVTDTNGQNTFYYAYTGDPGDTINEQNTKAGQVLFDFNTLIANSKTADIYLKFPDTTTTDQLERSYYDQGIGRNSIMIQSIKNDSIARIFLVEEWLNTDQNI